VIDVPVQDATDATVVVAPATDVLDTFAPVALDTSAAPTTTFEIENRLLSAVVATDSAVEHFLSDFLEEESVEYSVDSSSTLSTEFDLPSTALSSVYTTVLPADTAESTVKCYQLVAGAPLSIVTLVLLAAGISFLLFCAALF
jgi:hypothetical protein